jgi:hypothetical protein
MPNPGTLGKVFDKVKQAATPERFTQDFLSNTLAFKGNYALAVIPFLKKVGFLSGDGTPTELYKLYRNDQESGRAMAQALRQGYAAIYKVNEKAHELSDDQLKGVIIQVTGGKKEDSTTRYILQCFKAMKSRAKFDPTALTPAKHEHKDAPTHETPLIPIPKPSDGGIGVNLSYTINLNLPASTDIAVFNAIFQSLRQNLLRDE